MPKTDENKTLVNRIRKLAPDAIDTMGEMLRDPRTPAPTRAQLVGYILERTLGKPDTTIHLMTEGTTVKDSENRLIALAQEIREEAMSEPENISNDPAEEETEDTDECEYEDNYEDET